MYSHISLVLMSQGGTLAIGYVNSAVHPIIFTVFNTVIVWFSCLRGEH